MYEEKNILFPKHRKEMKNITDALSLPVTCVGDQVLIGFSSDQYEEVFKNK
jgi:arsenate reductase-like glutaredoxin family protein